MYCIAVVPYIFFPIQAVKKKIKKISISLKPRLMTADLDFITLYTNKTNKTFWNNNSFALNQIWGLWQCTFLSMFPPPHLTTEPQLRLKRSQRWRRKVPKPGSHYSGHHWTLCCNAGSERQQNFIDKTYETRLPVRNGCMFEARSRVWTYSIQLEFSVLCQKRCVCSLLLTEGQRLHASKR